MARRDERRSLGLGGGGALGARAWLAALALAAALSGCDDRLPGFADPPPYDGGDHGEDAGADDDAG